jgi:hypothetical protein
MSNKLKLYITDSGDPSVGMFPQTWEVDCPFAANEMTKEEMEEFRQSLRNLYKEFAFNNVSAQYDFELENSEE